MNRVALILTGGTIGSAERRSSLRAEEGTELLLLEKYREKGGKAVFDVVRSESLLSENFSERVMLKIARDIADFDRKGYRAAVVATGTDNLGSFSVLLSFLLSSLTMPIFLISSQYPLTDERENGSDNLLGFDAAVRRLPRGVYVLNRNLADDFVSVHAAVRMNQCLAPTGDFTSVSGLIGTIKNGRFFACEPAYSEIRRVADAIEREERETFKKIPSKLGNVAMYSVSPFSAPTLRAENPDAVFLNLFHSGTAATEGECSVIPFLEDCGARKIPVFAAPAFFGSVLYETTVKLAEYGVRFLGNTPPLAAELKVRFLFSSEFSSREREKYLKENLVGEVLERGNE